MTMNPYCLLKDTFIHSTTASNTPSPASSVMSLLWTFNPTNKITFLVKPFYMDNFFFI